jgi:hypothetical protein
VKSLLVFVLFAAMMCWLMFSPIYKHVLIVRQALLQKEVDYMLEVGASGQFGYIDSTMIMDSKQRLADYGLQPEKLIYEVKTTNNQTATDADHPVTRGIGISLSIRYPADDLYGIDRLIGLTPTKNVRISANGLKMSEYVP